ncbi:MAG: response regulator transcription factor [Actinobacteria bacterium]|nr:response regulator transcription factor [Actinomycetota bacterium]
MAACFQIEVLPCRDGTVLVTEQAIEPPYELTGRELEILHLVALGLSNAVIAERLYVARSTVSTHIEHILAKLSCSSRTQLAAKAVDEGLLLMGELRA